MQLTLCKSKIHRARITDANLHYEGSITIDETLMKAADLHEYEQVHVLDINNGSRFVTYVIRGKADSGVICINGAASRLVQTGDLIIIISYAQFSENEIAYFSPRIVHVDEHNGIHSL